MPIAKIVVCLICLVILSGCAATIPVSYTPQNFVRSEGRADIGDFVYEPAEAGKVRPNQISTTALGQLYISATIADFVKRGTALELEKSGIRLDQSNAKIVSGTVHLFKADDLGYDVVWSYSVTYRISRKGQTQPVFEKRFTPENKKTGKFGLASDYSSSVNEMILLGYQLFISDPEAKALLSGR